MFKSVNVKQGLFMGYIKAECPLHLKSRTQKGENFKNKIFQCVCKYFSPTSRCYLTRLSDHWGGYTTSHLQESAFISLHWPPYCTHSNSQASVFQQLIGQYIYIYIYISGVNHAKKNCKITLLHPCPTGNNTVNLFLKRPVRGLVTWHFLIV